MEKLYQNANRRDWNDLEKSGKLAKPMAGMGPHRSSLEKWYSKNGVGSKGGRVKNVKQEKNFMGGGALKDGTFWGGKKMRGGPKSLGNVKQIK